MYTCIDTFVTRETVFECNLDKPWMLRRFMDAEVGKGYGTDSWTVYTVCKLRNENAVTSMYVHVYVYETQIDFSVLVRRAALLDSGAV